MLRPVAQEALLMPDDPATCSGEHAVDLTTVTDGNKSQSLVGHSLGAPNFAAPLLHQQAEDRVDYALCHLEAKVELE